jgi:glycosyltransferase involved in cell wall biosynthesis
MIWTPMGIHVGAMPAPAPHPTNGKFRVVCTARFGPASNIDDILQAADLLQHTGDRRIEFILVGGGPEEARLRAYARQRRLENVEFTGMVSRADIPAYLSRADVCVAGLPDVRAYRVHGTIPSKVIDYLAAGRPVIFISSIEKSVVARARAGRVVPPGNPKQLADTISELAALPDEELAQLGLNGQAYIREHHDIDRVAQRIEALF